ncbi:MAG TPA: hypothetical protein VMT11_15425 [Myxococcaceae bacterium]|nr:hypothetical protein [Myxococcaceae bacterium]
MRRLIPLCLLAVCCSSQKSATYVPGAEAQQQLSSPPPLPPPPPLGPDQSMAKVTGCSDSANPSEQDAASFPPMVQGSRAPSATEVQLGMQPAGVWVAHNLTHACCTKAKIYVLRTEGQVNFFETVEGKPCGDGCMCTSQVQAALGVPPGRYGVALRIEDGAGSTIVKQSSFVVEAY